MTYNRGDGGAFRNSIYRKTLSDIRTLGQKMPEETLEHCLERADNSLFVAKNTGRNRVVVNERHDMN